MKNNKIEVEDITPIVDILMNSYNDGIGINQLEGHDLPNRDIVLKSLDRLFDVIFPGYFAGGHPVTKANLKYHIGDQINHIILELTNEVQRAFRYACNQGCCEMCNVKERASKVIMSLIKSLPRIREIMKKDIAAGFDGDPASSSIDEVITCYPAVQAIVIHRLAHELFAHDVPLIPRLWSEHAHSMTGIDIHPGAKIGERFFIDHGTGVVVGETCRIGNSVQIYQGVTLGALAPAKGQSIRGEQRHPIIEDNVIIYAGATILGGNTVIGKGATIGGNVWLTDSVDPGTKVVLAKADLVYLQPDRKKSSRIRPGEFKCPAEDICKADGSFQSSN